MFCLFIWLMNFLFKKLIGRFDSLLNLWPKRAFYSLVFSVQLSSIFHCLSFGFWLLIFCVLSKELFVLEFSWVSHKNSSLKAKLIIRLKLNVIWIMKLFTFDKIEFVLQFLLCFIFYPHLRFFLKSKWFFH